MNKNGRIIPFPYQKEGVRMIEKFNGRILLADSMGLGKTLQSLWSLKRNAEWLPALIVTPASVKYQWEYESNHHTGMRASICEGQKPPRFNRQNFSLQSPLTIINYDILTYWISYLKKLNFKTIIFDESQMLGNPKTKRTKAAKSIAKNIPHIMCLSGTPFENNLEQLFSTLNILWPKEFNSFWSFAQKHCNPKWTPWGWNFSGSSNLPELNKRLKSLGMIRRLKEDVLKDLPPKVRRIYPCELSNPDEYREASTNFMGWLKKNMAHKIRSASKSEKLVQVGYLLRLAAKLKIRSVVDWANRFLEDTDEKLIMFTVHQKAIGVLKRRINAQSVIVDGTITGRNRKIAVDQFQNDPKTRLFIGNIEAAGKGINLTAASTVGFTEISWRPGSHIQAEDRPHRIGQTETVWINYLIAGETLEEDLCKLLQKKQEVISAVLDGGPTPQDLNLYDELLKVLEEKAKI